MRCECTYDRHGKQLNQCESCRKQKTEYIKLQKEGKTCSCGEDEYGRFLSGECEYCKREMKEEILRSNQFFQRYHEVNSFGNELLQGWRPEMMTALEVAVKHSGNNPIASRALQDLIKLLNPAIKITTNKEYRWQYDSMGMMNGVFSKV